MPEIKVFNFPAEEEERQKADLMREVNEQLRVTNILLMAMMATVGRMN